jgi:hypothetical protein
MKTRPKKFWSRKAADCAVEECQRAGWPAGVWGMQRPFTVVANTRSGDFVTSYDLHTDGYFHKYAELCRPRFLKMGKISVDKPQTN